MSYVKGLSRSMRNLGTFSPVKKSKPSSSNKIGGITKTAVMRQPRKRIRNVQPSRGNVTKGVPRG